LLRLRELTDPRNDIYNHEILTCNEYKKKKISPVLISLQLIVF